MAKKVNKYRVWCNTDNKYEYIWAEEEPSTCPINASHSIDSAPVIVEMNDPGAANKQGVPMVEATIRQGAENSSSKTIVTIDFGDKTTWYQNSIEVVDEVVSGSDPWTQYQLANYPVINIDSYKLSSVEGNLLDNNGDFTNRSDWRMSVKVNDVIVTNWSINYETGLITFDSALSETDEVKVTYRYANPVNGSQFILRPDEHSFSHVVIEHAEVQFSKNMSFNDTLIFEIWATGQPGYSYPPFSQTMFDAGYGQYQMKYRGPNDFINFCNQGTGTIPAHGTFSNDVIVFPFNYVSAISMEEGVSALLRCYLENDIPYSNSEIATGTFYCDFISK